MADARHLGAQLIRLAVVQLQMRLAFKAFGLALSSWPLRLVRRRQGPDGKQFSTYVQRLLKIPLSTRFPSRFKDQLYLDVIYIS